MDPVLRFHISEVRSEENSSELCVALFSEQPAKRSQNPGSVNQSSATWTGPTANSSDQKLLE